MPLTGHSLNPPIGSKTSFGSSDPQRALQEQLSSQREGLCRRRLQPKTEEVWWFGQTVGLHMKNESQTCKIICIYCIYYIDQRNQTIHLSPSQKAYDILELLLQLHVSHQVLAEKSSGHTGVGQMLQFV